MNKYRIVLTTSLIALGGLVLAETIDVSREQPTNSAELPESRVNDEMARTLTINPILKPNEEVVLEEAGVSSANGSWALTEGTLTAFEVPILDSVGDFNVTITAPVKIKAGAGKGNSNAPIPSGWTGTAIGNYKIKCSNGYNSDTAITATCQTDSKFLIPYNSINTHLVTFSCPVNASNTIYDLGLSTEDAAIALASQAEDTRPAIGMFKGGGVIVNPVNQGESLSLCQVCKKKTLENRKAFIENQLLSSNLFLIDWEEFKSSGTHTQLFWSAIMDSTIAHENHHKEEYKTIFCENLFDFNIKSTYCQNCQGFDKKTFVNKFLTFVNLQYKNYVSYIEKLLKQYNSASDAWDGVDNWQPDFINTSTDPLTN